jgi:CubicO group peptidase (beta-lactamase class C family)
MNMNRSIPFRFVVVSILLDLMIGSHGLSQPTREDVAARIDEYLSAQTATGQFSGAVLVADDGQILFTGGYGTANIELSVPNTSLTKFRLASITKQFTAMAIMILQERGLLNVHDLISLYVRDCPGTWASITIHHLLTHTSGIPNFTSFAGNWPDYWRTPHTLRETIALFKNKPLNFTPGTSYEYSNSGYVLLGQIIEVVAGDSYEDFIRQNIFEPLGMSNSGCDNSRTIIMDRAAGYVREGNIVRNAIHFEMEVAHAAGVLYSTVEDLFLWDQALYTTQLVSQASLDAIFTGHMANYGYGWSIERLFNRTVCGHGGGVSGFSTYIGRFPEEGVLIVALGNIEGLSIWELWKALAGIVQETFDPMLLAHWAFDEIEGIIAHDSVGENDATILGVPLWQPEGGMIGGALQLSGVPNFATAKVVRNPSEGPLSVFAWVRGGGPGQVVISQQAGATWLMADGVTGALMTGLSKTGRKGSELSSAAVITDGDWHRIGFTWDGRSRALYVDGMEVAQDTQDSMAGSTGSMTLGAGSSTAPATFWKGLIDDVRIYDRAVKP